MMCDAGAEERKENQNFDVEWEMLPYIETNTWGSQIQVGLWIWPILERCRQSDRKGPSALEPTTRITSKRWISGLISDFSSEIWRENEFHVSFFKQCSNIRTWTSTKCQNSERWARWKWQERQNGRERLKTWWISESFMMNLFIFHDHTQADACFIWQNWIQLKSCQTDVHDGHWSSMTHHSYP